MVIGARRAALVAAVGAAATGAWFWWSSPERAIRRALDDVAARISHDAPLQGLAAAAAAAGAQDAFTPDAAIEPGPPFGRLAGRDAVGAAVARAILATRALQVEIVDVQVAVHAGGASADVGCTARARVVHQDGGETVEARELSIAMKRHEGRWRITAIRAVDVLEPVS